MSEQPVVAGAISSASLPYVSERGLKTLPWHHPRASRAQGAAPRRQSALHHPVLDPERV